MTRASSVIRTKLYDFIRVADDKTFAAIYHLLQDDINKSNEWWKDKLLTAEFEKRFADLESGIDKGYTIDQLKTSIVKLRSKKNGR